MSDENARNQAGLANAAALFNAGQANQFGPNCAAGQFGQQGQMLAANQQLGQGYYPPNSQLATALARRPIVHVSLAKLHDILERALNRLERAETGGDKAIGRDALEAILEEVRREAVDSTR